MCSRRVRTCNFQPATGNRFRGSVALGACLLTLATLSGFGQTNNTFQFSSLVHTAAGWQLGWPSLGAGTAYSVRFQDTVQDGIWRTPDSAVPFPVASNSWLDVSTTNSARIFRVIGVPAANRGKLVSSTYSNTVTAVTLGFLFKAAGIPITPQYDVRQYKLIYETITPLGARTQASGALLLPDNAPGTLPLLSYQHGTITQTDQAPSSMVGEVIVGIAFATSGYAAVVPDYLGLGSSPGFHPYHHARSEATACVDMLRAARTFCASNGVALTNQLFLCGYSQGGHATMALLRELETYHTNEFTVTACAPMAGAYDLSGVTTSNFLSGALAPNPYYFLYLLAAYQSVYHLAGSLADLLAPPYDTTLPPLLDGTHSGSDINAAMVQVQDPVNILKPEYLAAFRNDPRHPLRLALEENDLDRWRPRAPLHLYHCAADQDVIIANSEVALASFHALGATQVQLIDPDPTADHAGCSEPSLNLAKQWFDSLR